MMKDIQQSTSALKPAMAQELSHSLAEPGPPHALQSSHPETQPMGDSRVQGGCSKGRRNLEDHHSTQSWAGVCEAGKGHLRVPA